MPGARLPDLAALEVLVTVARTGSLSGAAGELGVSQQAVSARVAALEHRTGVALVVRTTRGSSLTPTGAVVSEWAVRLLEHAAELEAGLQALGHGARRTLRVAASLTNSEYLVPGWLVALRRRAERAPGASQVAVEVSVCNSAAVARLVRAGEADVGFVEGPGVPAGLRSRIVARDRLVVVVDPDHPWARAPSVSPAELATTPLVTREQGSGTREFVTAALRAALGRGHVLAAPALELSTTAAVRAAVLAGAGPAVVSELAVADDVAAGRLALAEVDGLTLGRVLRAVWVGAPHLPPGPARDLVAIAARAGIRPSPGEAADHRPTPKRRDTPPLPGGAGPRIMTSKRGRRAR